MKKEFKRFDMSEKPRNTKWFLRPLTYLLSIGDVKKHGNILNTYNTENLKPPFILLCNHNAFMDFKVATKALYPKRANYIVAIDGFIGREWLLRDVGCICKRKFTNDITLIRHIRESLQNGNVCVIYPEARYSLCGTTAVLPESIGALCKMLKVPVATLICHGHHINSPFWNLHDRNVKPTKADFKLLFTQEDLKNLSNDEISDKIVEEFQYDDFAWQKENNIKIDYEGNAEGLHSVLYQCPHCKKEFEMGSKGTKIFCKACSKSWTLSNLGQLSGDDGVTEFSHIPDWYEWERENVRKEVEDGTYNTGILPCKVDTLPNAKKFIYLGDGTLVHDMNGFHVNGIDIDGDPFNMEKPVLSMYSCHIEYNYLGKHGDCIDLNTLQDTWYIYPKCENFSITKMALATEELYFKARRDMGKPCRKGLA